MLQKLIARLFGAGEATERGDRSSKPSKEYEPVEYKGFLIIPEPQAANGQYRVSGWIRKPLSDGDGGNHGETRERRFERSDVVPDEQACVELTVSKSQRYIDDLGDDLFDQSH
ncbi:HlyU family transcriptional regulator [Salinicola halophilus]|uniref:HlyU family transcriptional regulator n=1 Tax=Salinicola halophilus TaxID=184065 RepID=UPI000DA13402|nr:HlyU family transcriptional regulator [Salinicola halophilus]